MSSRLPLNLVTRQFMSSSCIINSTKRRTKEAPWTLDAHARTHARAFAFTVYHHSLPFTSLPLCRAYRVDSVSHNRPVESSLSHTGMYTHTHIQHEIKQEERAHEMRSSTRAHIEMRSNRGEREHEITHPLTESLFLRSPTLFTLHVRFQQRRVE